MARLRGACFVSAAALEELVLEAAAAAEGAAAVEGAERQRAAAEAFVSFGDAARFWTDPLPSVSAPAAASRAPPRAAG